jgi:membrane protease YdiL (CAAX protease family)
MDDPDAFELEEAEGIGIFEPGSRLERADGKGQLMSVLGLTALGILLMVFATVIIMIPMMMNPDLIYVNPYTLEVYIDPNALLILTISSIVLVIPPVYYVRKHGLPISSIGIKNMLSGIDIGLGIVIGAMMLGSNIVISWLIDEMTGPITSGENLLVARNPTELILWVIAMFVLVGFTEEVLFRGFLQRRMDMYFKGQGNSNYKLMSLLITSFIFAVIHLDMIGLPARFILGMFLGDLAQRRKYNIVGPSVAHGFNNAVLIVLASLGF